MAMFAMNKQMQTMNMEETRTIVELMEVLEDIPVDKFNLEKFTRIRTSMKEKTKKDLVQYLKKSMDVFAWSHEYMFGIDLNVITHHLNVPPSYKPVHKKEECLPQNETMPSKKKSRNW